MRASNLHSHPLNGASKVPSKVVHDIREKVSEDPTIKTHDIITGTYIHKHVNNIHVPVL